MAIPLGLNFSLNAQVPLDNRTVVANETARDALVAGNRAYAGLIDYVTSENKYYYYYNNNWLPLQSNFTNLVYTTGNQTISGIKEFRSRPTVNGTGVLLEGEVDLSSTVRTTGSQNITGTKNFQGAVILGRIGTSNSPGGVFNKIEVGEQNFYSDGVPSLNWKDKILSGQWKTDQRLLVNGTGVLLSGEAAQVDLSSTVRTTGNQTIEGVKNFLTRPTLSGLDLMTTGDLLDIEFNIVGVITDSSKIVNATYSTLKSLQNNNQLISGQFYRISDFHLMWYNQSINDTGIKSGISPEPLIVQALSGNKISHIAQSQLYPQDTIYYDFDASGSYTWGTLNNNLAIPNFKGWIYRRIDNKLNIDIPWDWRHITVNCCRPDMSSIPEYSETTNYSLYSVVIVTNKLFYSIQNDNSGNSIGNLDWWSPVTAFSERLCYFPSDESFAFKAYNKNEVFIELPVDQSTRIQQPTFTSSFISQGTFSLINCFNIKINRGHSNIIQGPSFYSNTIGDNFSFNIIPPRFYSNTIGDNFSFNTIGSSFYSNTIRDNFSFNTIGISFTFNDIGNNFSFNTIRNNFNTNNISNNFQKNNIGLLFNSNIIGNNFSSNLIRSDFNTNNIGNYFKENTIADIFNSNAIENDFISNTIGDDFSFNVIGNYFNNSSIGNDFNSNTIGNNFSNSVGNNFNSNTIGNNFLGSFIGNNFRKNIVEDDILIIDYPEISTATHIYNQYNTRLFKNLIQNIRLSYFNSSDQLVVTDPTA